MKSSTRERHRREVKSEIVESAREIFVKDGFEGFSMRRLATRIGYSPAAIYLHFAGKEELFESLVEASFAHLHQRLQTLSDEAGKAPIVQLRRGLKLYVEWGLEFPDEYQIAFTVRTPAKKAYATHAAFDVARSLVRRCLAGSGLGGRELESRTQALWAAVHGVTALLIQRPSFPWVSRKRLIDDVIAGAVLYAVSRRRREDQGGLHAKQS